MTYSPTPERTVLLMLLSVMQKRNKDVIGIREDIYLTVFRRIAEERLALFHEISCPFMRFVQRFSRRHAKQLRIVRPIRPKAKRVVFVNSVSIANHFATFQRLNKDNKIG